MQMQKILEQKLIEQFQPQQLDIENESHKHSSGLGAESHFKILIVSEHFKGLNRVQRQQAVYSLLSEELKNAIHALSLRLLTSEEWQNGAGADFQTPNCHGHKPQI